MKLSHYDHEKELIKSKDLSDYYSRVVEGITKDIKQAMLILNPYNGDLFYGERLKGCSNNLVEIAALMDELSEEF